MFRKLKLATVIAVAISAIGIIDSAEAHIGRGGGGIRLGGGGGGLIPRARQGNANGNRGNVNPNPNPPVAAAPKPVPKPAPVAPPVVQSAKPPVAAPSTNTNKPNTGNVTGNNNVVKSTEAPKAISEKVQAPSVAAKAPSVAAEPVPAQTSKPVKANSVQQGHLVFSLTGDAAPAEATSAAAPSKGLPLETKKALEEAIAAEAPADEIPPTEVKPASATIEVVSKEVLLPQIPVGATLTLNGKDLSDKEGQVVLQIGEIALPATITEWKNDSVTCTLPVIGLTKASKATLHVLKADGKTASMLNCELVTTVTTSIEAK